MSTPEDCLIKLVFDFCLGIRGKFSKQPKVGIWLIAVNVFHQGHQVYNLPFLQHAGDTDKCGQPGSD